MGRHPANISLASRGEPSNKVLSMEDQVDENEALQFVDPKTFPYLTSGRYPSRTEVSDRMKGGKIYDTGYTIIEYILFKLDAVMHLVPMVV